MYEPEWRRPESAEECLKALSEGGDGARVIAGGTDLAVRMAERIELPPVLVDIGRVEELRNLETAGPTARLGAAVTHETVCGDRELARRASVLSQACGSVGAPQIRARGTVGGNAANASPAADASTALLALEARAEVVGADGERRTIPLRDFFRGPGSCALASCELLEAIEFDVPPEGSRSVYLKEGQRSALAIAVVSVAAVFVPAEGRVNIALGSAAPTPVRAHGAEELFAESWSGGAPDRELIRAVADRAVEASCCIDDVRASATYRERLVRALTERALLEICSN